MMSNTKTSGLEDASLCSHARQSVDFLDIAHVPANVAAMKMGREQNGIVELFEIAPGSTRGVQEPPFVTTLNPAEGQLRGGTGLPEF
jgi:hypothetical protein